MDDRGLVYLGHDRLENIVYSPGIRGALVPYHLQRLATEMTSEELRRVSPIWELMSLLIGLALATAIVAVIISALRVAGVI